jgi:hypothetical protein
MFNRRRYREHLDLKNSVDPLTKASAQSRDFSSAWLRNGDKLNWIQRIGYAIVSFLFLSMGLYLLNDAIVGFREASPTYWLSGLASIFLIIFGVLGLVNVLRFKKTNGSSPTDSTMR